MTTPQEILAFWFEEISPMEQFMGGPEIDDRISQRFGGAWEQAASGECNDWAESADGALALVILLDQFPRNMFRGSGKSFATDQMAREVADRAIRDGHDMQMAEPRRLFLYMPFMHSEELAEQDRCVDLIAERMTETGAQNLLHARAHRGIIEMFGRFPYRNEALGRENTAEEAEWMANVGYRKFVQDLEEAGQD